MLPVPPSSASSSSSKSTSGSTSKRTLQRSQSQTFPTLGEFVEVANSQKTMNVAARRQVVMTMCGAGFIVVSSIILVCLAVITWRNTHEAMDHAGLAMRKNIADSVCDEVALTLQPAYTVTRRLAEQARVGAARGSAVWPPTAGTFEHHLNALVTTLWLQLQHDLHIRRVQADGTGKEYIALIGLTASLAVQEDLQTPATSMGQCDSVLTANVNVGAEYDGKVVLYGQDKMTFFTEVLTDENGTKRISDLVTNYDAATYKMGPPQGVASPRSCEDEMTSLWGRPLLSEFNNFTWYGPVLDEYKIISGVMPLYTENGEVMGQFSASISVVYSITPLLSRMRSMGGAIMSGAELAVVSESGLLLGSSEVESTDPESARYDYVDDLPHGSLLGSAVAVIRSQAGTPCPARYSVLDEGDRLVDAMPFFAEDYGMPPLQERWCVILTFPRENVYDSIDMALMVKGISGIIIVVLAILAVVLLLASLWLALKSERRMRSEKLMSDLRRVLAAMQEVRMLSSPMVLVSASIFLDLPALQQYESLRDQGFVTVLDSLESIVNFKRRNMILFFSHQWLCNTFPDVDAIQLTAMKAAIRAVLSDPSTDKEVYVWCDFTSIAQSHQKMQRACIASLPVYARMADKFIVVAPPAVHADKQCECDLESYTRRGWCRAEMLAKACGSGIEEMYTCTDLSGTLSAITVEDLSRLSLNIFEGQFTVQEDMEDLMKPALGLYSLVLRERKLPHMRLIHSHIEEDKERFFPRTYYNTRLRQQVELFGPCVQLLEKYHSTRRRKPVRR